MYILFLYLPYGLWILIILLTFLIFIPVFQEAGVDLDKPIVATCGSGITACWIVMAGLLCGMKSVPLYDVSLPGKMRPRSHSGRPKLYRLSSYCTS